MDNNHYLIAGWTLSLLGFLLLLVVGNLGLAAVLVPIAGVLAIVIVASHSHSDRHVTHGLK
jgi:hypothetical protein